FADEDQQAKFTRDPVTPARRSADAEHKALTHTLEDGTPAHSFATLLAELGAIVRNTCRMPNDEHAPTFLITTTANPKQHRALELIRQMPV
ncbi:MAG: IS1634 family transposase, partial [Xanthomonadales bacterium]|nr:IS1634 family transposase [Xanthomonadales bacterium]